MAPESASLSREEGIRRGSLGSRRCQPWWEEEEIGRGSAGCAAAKQRSMPAARSKGRAGQRVVAAARPFLSTRAATAESAGRRTQAMMQNPKKKDKEKMGPGLPGTVWKPHSFFLVLSTRYLDHVLHGSFVTYLDLHCRSVLRGTAEATAVSVCAAPPHSMPGILPRFM
jgi:hypothetical protein